MKKITLLLISIYLLTPLTHAETYTNYNDFYSLEIPGDWISISSSRIDEIEESIGLDSVDYVAGYENKDYGIPYILVQQHDVGGASLKGIANEFESVSELGEPYIDLETNAVTLEFEIDNGGQVIKGLSVMLPGKHTITQLNFYSLDFEYSSDMKIYRDIINSFQYEGDRGYVDGSKTSTGEAAVGGGLAGMSVYLVGAVILGIVGLLTRKKEKVIKPEGKK
jgi:hypothetical protein